MAPRRRQKHITNPTLFPLVPVTGQPAEDTYGSGGVSAPEPPDASRTAVAVSEEAALPPPLDSLANMDILLLPFFRCRCELFSGGAAATTANCDSELSSPAVTEL